MNFNDEAIKKVLLAGNYIEEKDIAIAEEYAKEHRGSFVDYLLGQGLLSRAIIGQAFAESFGVSYSDLEAHSPRKEQVFLIPEELAKKYTKEALSH